MIIALIDFATKSSKYPRFTKEMAFNDEKHLDNYMLKANREGKKIIGFEILETTDPCVYVAEVNEDSKEPTIVDAARNGKKMTIESFERKFNNGEINPLKSRIFFYNINQ